jgi:hypothetical protein
LPLDSTPVLISAGQIADRGAAAEAPVPPELIKIAAIRAVGDAEFSRLHSRRTFVREMSSFARPMSTFARRMSGFAAALHTSPVHRFVPD